MYNNPFRKLTTDMSLLTEITKVMDRNDTERQATAIVNEVFGVYSKKALISEDRPIYDMAVQETLEVLNLTEEAPPGDKYERMVHHVKDTCKGDKEECTKIAYATAWKSYNKTHKSKMNEDRVEMGDWEGSRPDRKADKGSKYKEGSEEDEKQDKAAVKQINRVHCKENDTITYGELQVTNIDELSHDMMKKYVKKARQSSTKKWGDSYPLRYPFNADSSSKDKGPEDSEERSKLRQKLMDKSNSREKYIGKAKTKLGVDPKDWRQKIVEREEEAKPVSNLAKKLKKIHDKRIDEISDFGKAYQAARSQGQSNFTMNGKSYNTTMKGETGDQYKATMAKNAASAASSSGNAGVKPSPGLQNSDQNNVMGKSQPKTNIPTPPVKPAMSAAPPTGGVQAPQNPDAGNVAKGSQFNNPASQQPVPTPPVRPTSLGTPTPAMNPGSPAAPSNAGDSEQMSKPKTTPKIPQVQEAAILRPKPQPVGQLSEALKTLGNVNPTPVTYKI